MNDKTHLPTTLIQHYFHEFPATERDDVTILFNAIQQSCKIISALVRTAPIENLLGFTGEKNTQGEDVKKMDIMANDHMIDILRRCGKVCAMVSEENAEVIDVPRANRGPFIVCFDPIDGSSNIDNAIPVGTIFAVYRRQTPATDEVDVSKDILQCGHNLVCAGYSIYGSCTSIVIGTHKGVNGFTLDPVSGEFILTHADMKIKKRGSTYSVNEGNAHSWHEGTRKYVDSKKEGNKPYSLRYVGSMIADLHRTMLSGGVFLYPSDKKSPNGKLRLLYEIIPMSFIVEKAGGKASTGKTRILDVVPGRIHQRSPIYLGSTEDVDDILSFGDV